VKTVTALRSSINAEVGTPKSVCDLAAHYRLHELTRERKAFSTIENHRLLFMRYIEPRWGSRRLGASWKRAFVPRWHGFGVVGKRIGWHSFRHSLATNLRALGFDIKVAQELMRHSSCRTTLDVYTCAVDQQKREASLKVVKMMLPLDVENFQHPSAPSDTQKATRRCRQIAVKERLIGGPDRDRTGDLFHAMEARSQLRHRPTKATTSFILAEHA
jgi:Phage integrase family